MRQRIVITCCTGLLFATYLLGGWSAPRPGGGSARRQPVPEPMPLVIPPGFPPVTGVFDHNPPTKQGFELGRKLFYDGRLSKDGNFPCASCHQAYAAFSTYDHTFSHGFNNSFTTRNAPALFNLAWQKSFHWDGGVTHLELQPLSPLAEPNEMAEDLGNVLAKLSRDSTYRRMFKEAFGNDSINSQRMLKALAQFTGSIVSAGSKYDLYKQGKATFNEIELSGYSIYKTKCATCHPEPLFTDGTFRNNGLTINSLGDIGRMRITGKKDDSLTFKVPSLRNLLLTYPYMHDGRFVNLQQVLDHYTKGIVQSPTLDPLLKRGIPLTDQQKGDLLVFLSDLTDYSFTKDPRYQLPQ